MELIVDQPSYALYQVVRGRTRIEKDGVPGVLGHIGPEDGIFGQIVVLFVIVLTSYC